jgi:hypothetical protein
MVCNSYYWYSFWHCPLPNDQDLPFLVHPSESQLSSYINFKINVLWKHSRWLTVPKVKSHSSYILNLLCILGHVNIRYSEVNGGIFSQNLICCNFQIQGGSSTAQKSKRSLCSSTQHRPLTLMAWSYIRRWSPSLNTCLQMTAWLRHTQVGTESSVYIWLYVRDPNVTDWCVCSVSPIGAACGWDLWANSRSHVSNRTIHMWH